MDTATWLKQELTTLAEGRETTDDGRAVSYPDDYALTIHALNDRVGTVRWFLQQRPDGFVQRWGSPSLFTSLVLMALQDVAGAKRPLICRTCSGALRLACLPGTLLFGQMSVHDEQAHVPNTCGQQKPAAAEEPGDTRQKA